ncbi:MULTISPECIES: hypothetical protein [Novosphingobium]|nr:hypothetical protein [Novosphingobium resinovorum]
MAIPVISGWDGGDGAFGLPKHGRPQRSASGGFDKLSLSGLGAYQ